MANYLLWHNDLQPIIWPMEVNILEESPVFLPLSPRRSEWRRLLREQDAAASSGDALDFLNNQLAQARFWGRTFNSKGPWLTISRVILPLNPA